MEGHLFFVKENRFGKKKRVAKPTTRKQIFRDGCSLWTIYKTYHHRASKRGHGAKACLLTVRAGREPRNHSSYKLLFFWEERSLMERYLRAQQEVKGSEEASEVTTILAPLPQMAIHLIKGPEGPERLGPWPRSHSSKEVKPSLVFPDRRGQEYPGHPVPAKQGQAAHLALSQNTLKSKLGPSLLPKALGIQSEDSQECRYTNWWRQSLEIASASVSWVTAVRSQEVSELDLLMITCSPKHHMCPRTHIHCVLSDQNLLYWGNTP